MAQTLFSQTPSALSSFQLRFPRDTRLLSLIQAWRRRSAEKAELARFDARDLQDCGLTEADRAAIMATPLWREAGPRR